MTRIRTLTSEEIEQQLPSLDGWTLADGKLRREYKFKDFVEAFAFMTDAAKLAEEQNHHPEWSNVCNTVKVDLVTHEVSGISERDFRLARSMDELLGP